MDTNSIPYMEQVLKVNDALLGLPALPLVLVGCVMFGYFLKAIPPFPNRWIPAANFAAGILLNLTITPLRGPQEWTRAVILGMVASGAAWVLHKKVMSRWVDDRDFEPTDTAHISKPTPAEPEKDKQP